VAKHEAENASRPDEPSFLKQKKRTTLAARTPQRTPQAPHRANERSEAESNERSEAVGRNDRTNAGRANKGGYGEG